MLAQEERQVNQKRRCGLSPAQKTLLWQRWKDGVDIVNYDVRS
jgi:hypothetical protein